MPPINQLALLTNGNPEIQGLYAKYSAMLLGYIIEITKDRKLAEDYLVKVFCELAKTRTHDAFSPKILSWNQLRVFAMSMLPASGEMNKHPPQNADHQFVFNSVYYYGKSIAVIAAQLNRTEEAVRKILKEAFTTMKGNREN